MIRRLLLVIIFLSGLSGTALAQPGLSGPITYQGGGGSTGSSSGIQFTDGTHTVSGATQLTVSGGTIGGSTPNATLTIPNTTVHQISGATMVTATQFSNSDGFVGSAALALTYPATSTLSANGSSFINAQGGAITVTPNAADAICVNGSCQSAGATYVMAQGNSGWLTTDGSGHLQLALALSSASGGSGTVNSGTSGQLAYYASTGTAVSGTNAGTGVLTALGNNLSAAGGVTSTIASGTSALGTSAISSGTCATVVTTTATNVASTDVLMAGFNGDPTAVTGYSPATTGMLTIISYPTSGNVNFKVCNNTSSSITPGAITLNWRVVR